MDPRFFRAAGNRSFRRSNLLDVLGGLFLRFSATFAAGFLSDRSGRFRFPVFLLKIISTLALGSRECPDAGVRSSLSGFVVRSARLFFFASFDGRFFFSSVPIRLSFKRSEYCTIPSKFVSTLYGRFVQINSTKNKSRVSNSSAFSIIC